MIKGIFEWWLMWIVIALIIEQDLKAGIASGTFLAIVWFGILCLLGNFPVAII